MDETEVRRAAAKLVKLVEQMDGVSFVEVEREIPGFGPQKNDEEAVKLGVPNDKGGLEVYWIMSSFGCEVFETARLRLAMKPCPSLIYMIDGATLRLEPPDPFAPVVLRPAWATNFVAPNGFNIHVPYDQWPRLSRAVGKDAIAAGRRAAEAFIKTHSASPSGMRRGGYAIANPINGAMTATFDAWRRSFPL
jgi:hypothetical protein